MSVKPEGLLGDIKTANVFHHPVKSEFQYLYSNVMAITRPTSRQSYYNLSNVCLFVCLFVPLLLPGPWADLHQTWREGGGRPRI